MGERRSLVGIAGVVGVATALSKGLGLARSMAVAAVFGVGAVADAFAFAAMIPGFFLVVLGGQNGPLQSALVSVLSQDEGLDPQRLIRWAQRSLTLVLLPLSLGVVLAAGPLLAVLAPGLSDGTRQLAVLQLRWMAPMVLLSGWIGVGMARLISAGVYAIPSLSPMLSSTAVIAAAAVALGQGRWFTPGSPAWMAAASRTLALGMVLGALLQWLLQQLAVGRLKRAAAPARPAFRDDPRSHAGKAQGDRPAGTGHPDDGAGKRQCHGGSDLRLLSAGGGRRPGLCGGAGPGAARLGGQHAAGAPAAGLRPAGRSGGAGPAAGAGDGGPAPHRLRGRSPGGPGGGPGGADGGHPVSAARLRPGIDPPGGGAAADLRHRHRAQPGARCDGALLLRAGGWGHTVPRRPGRRRHERGPGCGPGATFRGAGVWCWPRWA